MPKRQTISYLTRRFREVGLEPTSRHGQNFLIDMNLQQLLVEAAELGPDDVVLEVGTGTGALTHEMAERAAHVVTCEIDQRLLQLAREELAEFDNITFIPHDALRNKNNYDPAAIEAVATHLAAAPGRQFKLAANLPYNIATPVISNLLLWEHVPQSMTVTIQKELADRMVASPSTKDYGALSVWIQSQCRVEIVRLMPPTVFWPRPKVDSAIIHIELDEALRARIPDLKKFHEFARSMFFHRRKFLRSVILSAYKNKLDKPQVDRVMDALSLRADHRAEQMSVEEMLTLCAALEAEVDG